MVIMLRSVGHTLVTSWFCDVPLVVHDEVKPLMAGLEMKQT